jgi:hypothetical protein
MKIITIRCFLVGIGLFCVAGCQTRHLVVASSGTNLGVEISQNPMTQLYQAKLGYNRAEMAIVPSNRSADEDAGDTKDGASDVPDVLMEMRYSGMFSFGKGSGIYQRLAVGKNAVEQPGASLMFAKGNDGTLDEETAQAIQSLHFIKEETGKTLNIKSELTQFRNNASQEDKQRIATELKSLGYQSWDDFIDGNPNNPTSEQLELLIKNLKAKGIDIK